MAVSDECKLALDGAMGMAQTEGYTVLCIALNPDTHDVEVMTNIQDATPATLAATAVEALKFLELYEEDEYEFTDERGNNKRIYEA